MSNEINEENYEEAIKAINNILYMYYDLIHSYKGFGHSIETGVFDPIFYVDSYLFEREGISLGIDINILHEGSAVAILCKLSDYWDEHCEIPEDNFAFEVKKILSKNRLDHLPLAEKAVASAFENEEAFREKLSEVYEKYVLEFFRKLIF